MRGVLGTRACARVCLLVSELVANAVVHGSKRSSDSVRVRIWTSPTSVRVAVRDRGQSFKPPRRFSPQRLETHGWGLYLVERLSDRWGVNRDAGTEVWFEVNNTATLGKRQER